jgi:hypothetical protein
VRQVSPFRELQRLARLQRALQWVMRDAEAERVAELANPLAAATAVAVRHGITSQQLQRQQPHRVDLQQPGLGVLRDSGRFYGVTWLLGSPMPTWMADVYRSDMAAHRAEHGRCYWCHLAGPCACACGCGGSGSWHEPGCPNA